MKKLGVVSVGRSDFSILEDFLLKLQKNKINFKIFASTAHFSMEYGRTVDEILKLFPKKRVVDVDTKIRVLSNLDLSFSIAEHISLFSKKFKSEKISSLLLLGDRFETFAAAIAATSLGIEIVHLHGGVITLGSMDNAFRGAISEMSKYHFVDNKKAHERLTRKGFKKSEVFFLGSLAVENFLTSEVISDKAFFKKIFGKNDAFPFALGTFHPSTKIMENDEQVLKNIIKGVTSKKIHLLFTFPNADINNAHIIKILKKEASKNKFLTIKKNLGTSLYYSAIKKSLFMIGNSSSGIIESSSCKVPAINIGSRQNGRDMNFNTLSCKGTQQSIKASIKKIQSNSFLSKAFNNDIYLKKGSSDFLLKKIIEII